MAIDNAFAAGAADIAGDEDSGIPTILQDALNFAQGEGLIRQGRRTQRVSARVDPALLGAAMAKSGLSGVSELIELALAQIVAADDFGERLVRDIGTVDPELDLEF